MSDSEAEEVSSARYTFKCFAEPQDESATNLIRVAFSMFDNLEFVDVQIPEEPESEEEQQKPVTFEPATLSFEQNGAEILTELLRAPLTAHFFYREDGAGKTKGKAVKPKKDAVPEYLCSVPVDTSCLTSGSVGPIEAVLQAQVPEDHALRVEHGMGESVAVTVRVELDAPLLTPKDAEGLTQMTIDVEGVYALPEAMADPAHTYQYRLEFAIPGLSGPVSMLQAEIDPRKSAEPYSNTDDGLTVLLDRQMAAEQCGPVARLPETVTRDLGSGVPPVTIPNRPRVVAVTADVRAGLLAASPTTRVDLVRVWTGKGDDPTPRHSTTAAPIDLAGLTVPGNTQASTRAQVQADDEEEDATPAPEKRPTSKKGGKAKPGDEQTGNPFVTAHTYVKLTAVTAAPLEPLPEPRPLPVGSIEDAAREGDGMVATPVTEEEALETYRAQLRGMLADVGAGLGSGDFESSPVYPRVLASMKAALLDMASSYVGADRAAIIAALHAKLLGVTADIIREACDTPAPPPSPDVGPVGRLDLAISDSVVLGALPTAIKLTEQRLVLDRSPAALEGYAALLLRTKDVTRAYEVLSELAADPTLAGPSRLAHTLALAGLALQKECVSRALEFMEGAAALDEELGHPTAGLPWAMIGATRTLLDQPALARPAYLRVARIREVEPAEDVTTEGLEAFEAGAAAASQLDAATFLLDRDVAPLGLRLLLRVASTITTADPTAYHAVTRVPTPRAFEGTLTPVHRHKALLAVAHNACGRHQQATQVSQALLAERDDVALAWRALGEAELAQGKAEEGLQAFRAALRQATFPEHSYVRDARFVQTVASLLLTRARPPISLLPSDMVQAAQMRTGSASRARSRTSIGQGRMSVRELRDLKRRQKAPAASVHELTPREAIDDAFNVLRHACTAYPGLSTPWALLSRTLLLRGDMAAARHALGHANALNPTNGAVWGQAALLLLIDGHREAADRALGAALEHGLGSTGLLLDLAEVYHVMDAPAVTEGLLHRVLGSEGDLTPESTIRAHTLMGRSAVGRGALDEAVPHMEAAIKAMPPSTARSNQVEQLYSVLLDLGRTADADLALTL